MTGAILLVFSFLIPGHSQTLDLPPREADALTGSEFVRVVTPLSREDRENWILAQVLRGNVPGFLRALKPITVSANINGSNHTATYYVAPDHLAIGSDDDYFLCPMTPLVAQRMCDSIGCTMPTRRMVNQIWTNATVKLPPNTIDASPEMITVPVFDQHNFMVRTQRLAVIDALPLGELVSGTKKDVVISLRIYGNFASQYVTKPVVIYGWHYTWGVPIQPLYNGHVETYVDYSHGIRLVQMAMTVDGQPNTVTNVCASGSLAALLSDEGVILTNRYRINPLPPNILEQPEDQITVPGQPATFNVLVAGDGPLSCQWRHEGTNLPGATLPFQSIPDPQSSDEGEYRVFITNSAGTALSIPASLVIVTSTPVINSIQRPSNDRVALTLTNAPASLYLANGTTDFATWQPVSVLPSQGNAPPFLDPFSVDAPRRFYRASQTTGQPLIDFEGVAVGSPALFQAPSYSGSTAAFIDTSGGNPNHALVTNNSPPGLSGAHALHVAWTFASGAANPWLRLTSNVAAALPNPTVDFNQGLSFDAYADRNLFVALGLRETDTTSAVGGNGGASGAIEWVGGTTDNSTSPPRGRLLTAGQWTRVSFIVPDEPVRGFTGNGVLNSATGKGVWEHLALLPAAGVGAYNLYLDNFQTFDPHP